MNQLGFGVRAPAGDWPSDNGQIPRPYTDRRALSEAWYDALYRRQPGHLEKGSTPTMQTTYNSGANGAASTSRPAVQPKTNGDYHRDDPQRDSASIDATDNLLEASDAVSLQGIVRAALQRALAQRAAGEVPTLGTIRVDVPQSDGTQIRLVVAQTPSSVGIVAVCTPAHRSRVERCLGQMREKLALAGIPLECKVHER